MKKLFIFFLLIGSNIVLAGGSPDQTAKGIFLAFGVGPRFPMGSFANTSKFGYGFNAELSYTNDEYLPVFLFLKSGFENFPGSQDFYRSSDYSNYSTNVIPVNLGIRYYFPPIINSLVIVLPLVEFSANYGFYHVLNEFKAGSGKNNFTQNENKFGFSAGVGLSAFMMEILASYNYYKTNQFISIDFKIRFPIYINM
ncbi:MAG: hypothetical protein WB779_15625 [Ignavibacteriaceae bacterium]